MKTQSHVTLACASACLLACGDATGPEEQVIPCTDETGSVAVTVGPGFTPTLSWSPTCTVAMILVEEDASDMWGAATEEDLWDSPAAANVIAPPVTYGAPISGTTTFQEPLQLEAGHTYDLVLWRILPASSNASCLQRFENACLLAVQEFVR